ncbi:hypothetical protein ABVT39_011064 [Epinephelus coioides]
MDRARAAYFSQEEQVEVIQGYEKYKTIITAKSNTVSANKAREECWQKIADRVNACGTNTVRRTWQQIRTKHKNIIRVVGADTIRALYKRNLELDNKKKKELEIKKLKLEIGILEMKSKHMQRQLNE